MSCFLVTGGAGFIGSHFVKQVLRERKDISVINLDLLTYAGNLESLSEIEQNPNYRFVKGDIGDRSLISELLLTYNPTAVINFAAESHVDRSIDGPEAFFETNVMGTLRLIDESRKWYMSLSSQKQKEFRFLHVSTDEVYGTLGDEGLFTEETSYAPNSPYSASKASSDHIVRAYYHTYDFPVLTTNCSNNYGPYQFPEKLIPLIIQKALAGEKLPIYGDGMQIRDWLYVEDHCQAIQKVLEKGICGETYNIGGHNEIPNIKVVEALCILLDEYCPKNDGGFYYDQVTFVADRPGHDRRYAIDATKIGKRLGWYPEETFETGIRKTIKWYLDHKVWIERVSSGKYRQERLGIFGGDESK